jgi:hypothetical protein
MHQLQRGSAGSRVCAYADAAVHFYALLFDSVGKIQARDDFPDYFYRRIRIIEIIQDKDELVTAETRSDITGAN